MPRIRTVTALATAAFALVAGAAYAAPPLGTNLGPAASGSSPKTYLGYYDANKDSYVIADVSSKSQAAALRVNYSAAIGTVKDRRSHGTSCNELQATAPRRDELKPLAPPRPYTRWQATQCHRQKALQMGD